MPRDPVSRRQFLHNAAAGTAGGALGTSLVGAPAAKASSPGDPPFPHTMESYPIAEPGKGTAVDHMKIVSMENMPDLLSGAHPLPYPPELICTPGLPLLIFAVNWQTPTSCLADSNATTLRRPRI